MAECGICECGCGQQTWRATKTDPVRGWVKGKFVRFARGHRLKPTAEERFWAKVAKRGEDECWPWLACKSYSGENMGHGRFLFNGRSQCAHRVVWQLTKGAIPVGLFVCHRCDVPECVNPKHLFLDTNAGNTADMVRKGRNRAVFGSRNGFATLTEQQALEVKRCLAEKVPTKEISARFGIAVNTIYAIKHGRTWRHV